MWYVGCHDSNGRELYRQDASHKELADLIALNRDRITIVRQFASSSVPASWTVLPLSASVGWLEPIMDVIP